jgi:hypothetical protein
MKRRDLLKVASATAGALAISPLAARAADIPAQPPSETEVLVVGGGTAGSVAALQAARAGAKTALLEMGSQLGGTTTTGGVAYPGLFHAWGQQVIAGIGWELVQQAVQLDGGTMPDFTKIPERHSQHQVRINGQLYAALAEEACLKAGVSLAYYQFPLAAKATADGWLLEIVGKGVRYQLACRQLIDCTGGADVVGMLGLDRLREDTTQPGTLIFKLGGYDPAKLDAEEIQRRYLQALADGELEEGDYAHAQGRFLGFLQGGGHNAQHVFGADSSTAATKTQANIAGRRSVLRLLRFVRTLPGCERARIEVMMQETAVRETYRIVGEATITCDDYTSGRQFDDAVCYSFYPVDLHDRHGVSPQPLARGTVPTVPRGALVPKGSRNLLVAGRSVCSDRLANSALRVQASCMAMGQAAGAAAALAVRAGATPTSVPLDEIRALLRQHAAIVPG